MQKKVSSCHALLLCVQLREEKADQLAATTEAAERAVAFEEEAKEAGGLGGGVHRGVVALTDIGVDGDKCGAYLEVWKRRPETQGSLSMRQTQLSRNVCVKSLTEIMRFKHDCPLLSPQP